MVVHSVPVKPLTPETAAGLGTLITNIDEAMIEHRRWQPSGHRPVTSGGYGQTVQGPFEVSWRGDMLYSHNNAIGRSDLLGWCVDPADAREDSKVNVRDRLLVDEVNYHDDGGQAFIALGVPTVFLIAPPGDDVMPGDFVALVSNGRYGLNMHPGVWHTAPIPMTNQATFDNKQGSIHATVALMARKEWGLLLDVPISWEGQ